MKNKYEQKKSNSKKLKLVRLIIGISAHKIKNKYNLKT